MARYPQNSYLETEVLTADPGKLILLLFDGAIHFLKQGKIYLLEEKHREKGQGLMRAHAVVSELLHCLNREKGGDIAIRLQAIYVYILQRITDADLKKETGAIDECVDLLSELREAWYAITHKSPEDSIRELTPETRTEFSATI
ncbi:MAG: flagellar export chaperone FliS [Deltaproteobacteria bacterium]|nr:flagellar export chaperone FliS [Deltaproteobacteria bacterium]